MELKKLMSKSSANSNDFASFIQSIMALSEDITDGTSFTTFSEDIKDWISAFKVIFPKAKVDPQLQKYINKYSKVVTKLYLKFAQCFHEYEPTYIQEFYCHWKEIVSAMSRSVRAKTFILYIGQFNLTTEHLEDAGHRFEQMTILKLLRLYTEKVTNHDLEVAGNDNYIVKQIIKMGTKASLREQHEFLNHINDMDTSIFTIKPTYVITVQPSFTFSKLEYDMWVDFNLQDKSVVFVAVSSTNEEDQCMAIVSLPKIKENIFMGNYVMIINGYWSLLQNNEEVPGGAKIKIMVISPIYVREFMLKSKNIFQFLPNDFANPNFKDDNRNVNKIKESYDTDTTTVYFPSVCSSCNNDGEEAPLKKPVIIGNGAITDMPYRSDEFDSNSSEVFAVADWTNVSNENQDSQELPSESLFIPLAHHLISANDNLTSNNYDFGEESHDGKLEQIAEYSSLNENQSENDEQMPYEQNMIEKLFPENSVSKPQQVEVNLRPSSAPPAQSLQQAKPQRIRKRALSANNVSTSFFNQNNGEVVIEIRSHTVSIVEETVNDVISKTNENVEAVVQSSRKSCQSDDKGDAANEYRKHLRPRNRAKTYDCAVSRIRRKRRKASGVRVSRRAGPNFALNIAPSNKIENDDLQMENHDFQMENHDFQMEDHDFQMENHDFQMENHDLQMENQSQLEQSLKAMTECKDQISRIHGECKRYLEQYIESLKSLLVESQRNLVRIPMEF